MNTYLVFLCAFSGGLVAEVVKSMKYTGSFDEKGVVGTIKYFITKKQWSSVVKIFAWLASGIIATYFSSKVPYPDVYATAAYFGLTTPITFATLVEWTPSAFTGDVDDVIPPAPSRPHRPRPRKVK